MVVSCRGGHAQGAARVGAALALVGLRRQEAGRARAAGWAAVRAQFALDPATATSTRSCSPPHPKPVRAAIERHGKGSTPAPRPYLHAHEARLDEAVAAAAAAYLGVSQPTKLAFVDSTTMGLAMVSGLKLKPGDEVLTTEHDHYATHESLRLSGATVRKVAALRRPCAGHRGRMIDAIKGAITDRTKVLAVTWVHSVSGVKLPIRKLAEALGSNRPLLVVDGVHALGVEPDRIEIEFCDVFVAGHAQVARRAARHGPDLVDQGLGPDEPGDPVVRLRALHRVDGGRRSTRSTREPGVLFTPGGYHSFEHRWALADAFTWQSGLGRDKVAARIHGLAKRLKDGIAGPRATRHAAQPGGLVRAWSASTSTGCDAEDGRRAPGRSTDPGHGHAVRGASTSGSAPRCTSTSATWTQPWGLSKRFGGRLTGTNPSVTRS